jgi:SAM-dependent methyltransferase
MSHHPDAPLAGIWTGAAADYDAYRPRTPAVLLDLLPQLADIARPRLVVDLGAGSGLSTFAWVGRADEVIGVEPNGDMRRVAQAKARPPALSGAGDTRVRFIAGVAHATGLPDACADLVTASQSLHWMEPSPTFAEIGRILRPGGVFAAYDYDWPVVIIPETDLLYAEFQTSLDPFFGHAPGDGVPRAGYPKGEHEQRMRESGQFRLTREICVHSEERGDAERFIGLMLSNSGAILLQRGVVTAEQLNLDGFRERARALLGERERPWYFSYRVRYGVK